MTALPKRKSDTMKLIKLSAMLALALAMTVPSTGCKKRPTPLTNLPNSGRTPSDRDTMSDPNAGK